MKRSSSVDTASWLLFPSRIIALRIAIYQLLEFTRRLR
jgi:hypothetical protein